MYPIKGPAECLADLKRRLSGAEKTAFCSAFLIGFFCHLFIFTNSMYNNDDIRNLYVSQDRTDLGRWLLTYAAGISSFFSLPVVNGLLSLFFLSLTGMVIVRMFHLQNKCCVILVCGLLVTFPSVACTFSYMFTADAYYLSCLLAALAAYLAVHENRNWFWIAGAVCLCCSAGIYQAYLTFVLLLLLLYFILALLQPARYSDKQIISLLLRCVLMLGAGMGAYYLLLTAALRTKQTTLSSYQGISQSTAPGLSDIGARLRLVYEDFFRLFKPGQMLAFNRWMLVALCVCLLLPAVLAFVMYCHGRLYTNPLRTVLLLLCIVAAPLCANTIYLISSEVNYHILMRHCWCLLFIAPAVFFEKAAPLFSLTRRRLLEWICVAALSLAVWNYVLLTNTAYFNMNFRYEKTYALCMKIMDRIEQSDDYDSDRPLAFIGDYSKTYKMEPAENLLSFMVGTKGPRVFGGASRAYLPFFQNCLGEDITVVTPEEEEALKATPAFQEMPRFPHDGSIRVIDGVTVIKLNDD